jgi:23S rRNA pseudouridine2605 synthase
MLDDGPVKPRRVEARKLGRDRWEFEVTITEGRKREVRRLCTALGLTVERLVRVKFGPVTLGDLPSGGTRRLTPRERAGLGIIGR